MRSRENIEAERKAGTRFSQFSPTASFDLKGWERNTALELLLDIRELLLKVVERKTTR